MTNRRQRKKRRKQSERRSYVQPGMPVTIWSAGDFVRVWVAGRVIQMRGTFHRHRFLIEEANIRHWGIGSGARISAKDKEQLMQLLEASSAGSPWMRIQFVTKDGRRVFEPKWKQRIKRYLPFSKDSSSCCPCL